MKPTAVCVTPRVPWACPRCGAKANEHGKGGAEKCRCTFARRGGYNACEGFLCECDLETGERHGETFDDPCTTAHCGHCEWAGTFPVKPKGMQAWERKALDAGWSPPAKRASELGLEKR